MLETIIAGFFLTIIAVGAIVCLVNLFTILIKDIFNV